MLEKSLLTLCRPVGYLHGATEELNSAHPRTNPVSSRVEYLNPGLLDYKSSPLTSHLRPSAIAVKLFMYLVHEHIRSTHAKKSAWSLL